MTMTGLINLWLRGQLQLLARNLHHLRRQGGSVMGVQLMSSQLHVRIKVWYAVTSPAWDWYSNQVTNIKTPGDGLR